MYGSKVDEYESKFLASIDQYAPNTTYDDGVVTGYKAISNTTSKIFETPTGQIELLFMNSDANGDIGITAALQHPFSHGRIYINSSNPMDFPVIDPNYLNNPAGVYSLQPTSIQGFLTLTIIQTPRSFSQVSNSPAN